jgi:hypothetical protein
LVREAPVKNVLLYQARATAQVVKRFPDGAKKTAGMGLGRLPAENITLYFSDRDSAGRADLDAGLTAQALFFVHRIGFAFLHLKDADGTYIDAFFVAGAFVCINFDTKTH